MHKSEKNNFGKVAVLMGGEYSERAISLMSGNAVLDAFLREGIDAHAVDVGPNICEDLVAGKFDRAFVALHGTQGEDGTIQGLLDCLNIPYTGSDVLASAIAMDKEKSKLIWSALGLPTLPFEIFDEVFINNINKKMDHEIHLASLFDRLEKKMGLPLAIKPTSEGSSVGVSRVANRDDFIHAIEDAISRKMKIMVEPWLDGDEYTVSILDDEALPVIRIATPEGFYDYQAKYFSDATGYFIPSDLSPQDEEETKSLALQAYQVLGCRHWGRVDLLRDAKGKFWLMEVNTIPGLTSHSLVPMAAKAQGISFDELVVRILKLTVH